MGRGVFKLHPSRHTNRSFECDLLSPHPFINSAQRLLLLSPESPVLISILFSPPLSLSLSLVECSAEIQAVQDRTGLLVWTLFMFFCLLCVISLGSGHLVLERLEICCIIIGSLLPVVCWSSINWGFSGSCFGISSYHFLGWFWLMYFPTNSFHAWSSWWLIHSGFRLSAAILLFVFSPPPNCLLYGTESSSLCFLDAFLYAFF